MRGVKDRYFICGTLFLSGISMEKEKGELKYIRICIKMHDRPHILNQDFI